MSYLITAAAYVLTWLSGALDWFLGTSLETYVTAAVSYIEVIWRFTLTLSSWLAGPAGPLFMEAATIIPLVAVVLKSAVWVKGQFWSGGAA